VPFTVKPSGGASPRCGDNITITCRMSVTVYSCRKLPGAASFGTAVSSKAAGAPKCGVIISNHVLFMC